MANTREKTGPAAPALQNMRSRFGGAMSSTRSPLTRKIITFNLVALSLLVTGILFLNQTREGVIDLRKRTLVADAQVLSITLAQQLETSGRDDMLDPQVFGLLERLSRPINSRVQIYSADGTLLTSVDGRPEVFKPVEVNLPGRTNSLDDILSDVTNRLSAVFKSPVTVEETPEQHADNVEVALQSIRSGRPNLVVTRNAAEQTIITAGMPITVDGQNIGALVLSTLGGEIDSYLSGERKQILQVFFLAIVSSVLLSFALANTIGRPLRDLAEAARRGSIQKTGRVGPERVDIPDMSERPDEIGELSRQLRNMTEALYDRIEANESFAADVAHEIKNPLTSLGSAVESMDYARTDADRKKLLDVIRDDVRRMDRLVTDISNASRLDAELAKDEMEVIDLGALLKNICDYQNELAQKQDVRVVTRLPQSPLEIHGLENRLAQVFVNLVTNAVSFVPGGGQVTVTLARDGEQARVLVEDTGPGIPEENLKDIFKRFYSSRPKQEFGNNSGLGLAISRQIVDAHGGNIWAENIYAEDGTTRTGARFTVTLPI